MTYKDYELEITYEIEKEQFIGRGTKPTWVNNSIGTITVQGEHRLHVDDAITNLKEQIDQAETIT